MTLTVNQEQAEILVRALDLYSRIGLGQFEEILDVYDRGFKLPLEQRENVRFFAQQAKLAVGHPVNGSHGIHNPEVRDEFRAAYDIQQVVRNRLAYDRKPEGGIQVCFDTPRQISQIPLPTIKSE